MNQLYFLLAMLFMLGIATGLIGFFGIRKLMRMGKALVIWIDRDTRQVSMSYHAPSKGKISTPDRDYLVDGTAKHGGKYSTWLIDPTTGWNYRAATRAETFDRDPVLAVLEPSNPESYHRAIHRNRWAGVLRAGEDEDKYKWVPIVAIIGLAALIVVMLMVGYLITNLSKAASAAGV